MRERYSSCGLGIYSENIYLLCKDRRQEWQKLVGCALQGIPQKSYEKNCGDQSVSVVSVAQPSLTDKMKSVIAEHCPPSKENMEMYYFVYAGTRLVGYAVGPISNDFLGQNAIWRQVVLHECGINIAAQAQAHYLTEKGY